MSIKVKASGVRPGDVVQESHGEDHRNKRLRVTRVERGGAVRLFGMRKGATKESLLVPPLAGNSKITIHRAA